MNTFLATDLTVAQYKALGQGGNTQAIADFIERRFTERYITPMRVDASKKNGFTIMAVACLLIEALESFRQGWPNSDQKSQLAFCNFFDRTSNFTFIRGYSQDFYKNVRCEILHQGETTGGWHIRRKGPIFDKSTKTVNAKKFHDEIEKVLKHYCDELRKSSWDSEIWKALRKKMRAICRNCETEA